MLDNPVVLIVDDDPASIQVMAQMLMPAYQCEYAMSGPQALERLASGPLPALILLDVLMPEMDGYSVCRCLQSDTRLRDIPVICVTASEDPDSETTALKAGAVDFISKPIGPHVLSLRVGLHLRLREREIALQQLNAELEKRVSDRTRELSEALGRAEAANHAKRAFLSNMSHEIRTPLNAVIGVGGILKNQETDAAKRRRLDIVLDAANQLTGLLTKVLELSRTEASQAQLTIETFQTAALAQRVQGAIGPLAEAKELAFSVQFDRLPTGLRGDQGRLADLLIHLLDNAVKFTASGSVSVEGAVLAEAGQEIQIAFTVRDTGCGIDPAAQDRILLPFEQQDNSIARRYPGAGLGLTIARQLAELMSGRLRIEAGNARGTTVVAELWLGCADAQR